MLSGSPEPQGGVPAQDQKSKIRQVMHDCQCSRKRAIMLLERCENDPELAKLRYCTSTKSLPPRKARPPPPATSHQPPWRSQRVQLKKLKNGPESLSSDDEGYVETSFSEKDLIAKRGAMRGKVSPPAIDPDPPSFEKIAVIEPDDSNLIQSSFDALDEANATSEWNLVLPVLPIPCSQTLDEQLIANKFDITVLAGMMQHGATVQAAKDYLSHFDLATVKRDINDHVEGFPAMFFAVATNNEDMMRLWVDFGASVTSVHQSSKVPLLAFAIMLSEIMQADTTLTVATLLSLGASPRSIPKTFYTPFYEDHLDNGAIDESFKEMDDDTKSWCKGSTRLILARSTNLSQRYYLEKADNTKKPSLRRRQIAARHKAQALLGIPYFLIGQTLAANLLLNKLLNYLTIPSKRPLVLLFAGPSGHGKTEMARRLGHLLSLELEVVDCTIISRELELFGPRHPYVGAERGSPLNNFLADNAGKRGIVFLDEFEKTTKDIHQALLLPFDNGEYQDRRHLKTIDCSKTIWILATNALDDTIQSFCTAHNEKLFDSSNEDEKQDLAEQLSKKLKQSFLAQFGAPMTGRISSFIPFLPFTPTESAAIVHKHLLLLAATIARPINLTPGPNEQFLGNVNLHIRRDASVCLSLAEEFYHRELGVRPLIGAVKVVEEKITERYLDINEEVTEEDQRAWEAFVDVENDEVVVKLVPSAN